VTACAECGFDYEELPVPEVGAALRGCGQAFRDALGETDGEAAATRPEPTVWSALEYACHLRDVLLVQRDRLVLAQVRERPELAPMSSEERVAICRYDAQPLTEVLEQLSMAAELCALAFEGLDEAGLARELVYNFPEPVLRTVGWMGVHTVHEGVHHLADADRVLARVRDLAGAAPGPGTAAG